MAGILNTRILASIAMLVFVGAVVASSTGAFFNDTETSTGNTFTAGALDLKIDSTAHYNGSVCALNSVTIGDLTDYTWQGGNGWPVGEPCDGTWAQIDLGATNQFFQITDAKPGDDGENTISLHVTNNDAWGRFVISAVKDYDNTCTEPEEESVLDTCTVVAPEGTTPGSGELAENITFSAWLDQGTTPGFQCNNALATPQVGPCNADLAEGDNIQQCATPGTLAGCAEPTVIAPGTVDDVSNVDDVTEIDETHNLWTALAAAYAYDGCTDTDGNTAYGLCHGVAQDGRMVGSTTYYFGLGWTILDSVGNEAQTDSLNADLSFQAVQHRNNGSQTF